jgi:hypothetical protein
MAEPDARERVGLKGECIRLPSSFWFMERLIKLKIRNNQEKSDSEVPNL